MSDEVEIPTSIPLEVIVREILHLEYLLWNNRTGPARNRYRSKDLHARRVRVDTLRWVLTNVLPPDGEFEGAKPNGPQVEAVLSSYASSSSGRSWTYTTKFADWRHREESK